MSPIYTRFELVANATPDKIALYDDGQKFSYLQLLQMVDRLALKIVELCAGVRPRVALITNEHIDNVCVSLALAKLGGCCVPMNAHMLPAQLQSACKAVDANMVIGKQNLIKKSLGNLELTHLFTDDVSCKQAVISKALPAAVIALWLTEDDYLITLSSGSTGQPKPIMISQTVKLARAEQTWALYQLSANDTVLCASPFFTLWGSG